jgi:hypothetical protein
VNRIGHEFSAFLSQAMPWLIPVGIAVLCIGIAIALLVIWLSSRGQFMFLDCIVHNRGAVSAPWATYKNEGNSLFGFKFLIGLAAFILSLAGIIPLVIIFITFAQTDFKVLLAGPMIGAGFILLALFLMWMLYSLITVLTDDFVVPVMYLRRCGVIEAWKEFMGLFSANLGTFILYVLVIIAVAIVLGLLGTLIVFTACCCFCCVSWVFIIPVVGGYLFSVLLLPLSVWRRSYAVLFLSQFGPGYNVFAMAQVSAPQPPETVDIEPVDVVEPTEPTDSSQSQEPQNPQDS